MFSTEIVRTNPHIDEDQALRVTELWVAAYPSMRQILDSVIRAQRTAANPTVDIPALERVRLELGQMDRGTYRGCTRGEPVFIPSSARIAVHAVLNVTSIGHPYAGDIYRLAAELADLTAADHRRRSQDQRLEADWTPARDGGWPQL